MKIYKKINLKNLLLIVIPLWLLVISFQIHILNQNTIQLAKSNLRLAEARAERFQADYEARCEYLEFLLKFGAQDGYVRKRNPEYQKAD